MSALRRSRSRVWFQLRWPFEVTTDHLAAALASLTGLSTPHRRDSLVLLTVGQGHMVTHYAAVRESRRESARAQLEAAVPGLALVPVDHPPVLDVDRCWRAWINTTRRPLATGQPEASARGLLTALASAQDDEVLVLRWVLGPVHRPKAPRPRRSLDDLGLGVPDWLSDAVTGPTAADDPEARAAQFDKQGQPGWQAALHIAVGAIGRRRQRQLLAAVASAVRVSQAPGAQIGFRPTARRSLAGRGLPRGRSLLVNTAELRGLAAWPLGATEELPVERERSRLLRPSPLLTHTARVLAVTTYPSAERPLGLSAADALHHLYALGPTGVGKTTLLLNLICQDIDDGRSVVVIEPRGDLVTDVLARVPDHRLDDIVVIDPTDPSPVGLNPLAVPGVDAELRVDHLVTVFKGLWAESWGPRTEDILTSGLLTLAKQPGMSLAALPLLFSNDGFRAQLTADLDDPLGLGPFWAWFEALPPVDRAKVLGPVMNKLRAFLLRERLRRVVGQSSPRFDLRDVYRRRPVVLVNLCTGTIGPEAAALLGSLVLSQLWQTILGRAAVPVERRHPVMVYVDEFQQYLHLPTDLADVLAQARGLGVGLTLAHQHLAQLHPAIRAAVLANARSRVVFATNHDDAQALVRNAARLNAADVVGLGRYAVYASLLAGGEATPWASARTLPPPAPLRDPEVVRDRSRQRWGTPRGVIDAELQVLARGGIPQPRRDGRPDPDHATFGRPDGDKETTT
jgi:hypothetical protein